MNMNKYVVKLDEKFCQERWGVVREAYVYIKLSEEVVKTIYKSSNGNVYFKTMQDSIVLSASASIFYNAERAVERAIEQAVKEKLRTFEKYVDRFEITLDEIDLKEFFAELEKVKTYERMCNIAKKKNEELKKYYNKYKIDIGWADGEVIIMHFWAEGWIEHTQKFKYTEIDEFEKLDTAKLVIDHLQKQIQKLEAKIRELEEEKEKLEKELERKTEEVLLKLYESEETVEVKTDKHILLKVVAEEE